MAVKFITGPVDTTAANLLPIRSRTYPLQESKTDGRVKQGEPFDPEDLCRRLERHRLKKHEEQEERRRRRERAERFAVKGPYHHTPQYAAVDFTRTTTQIPVAKKDVHKLSQTAVAHYLDNPEGKGPGGAVTVAQWVDAQESARRSLEDMAERNQFQRTKAMEGAASLDKERDINKTQKRKFDLHADLSKPLGRTSRDRPLSTGDIDGAQIEDPHAHVAPCEPRVRPNFHPNDRHDWAQRDESSDKRHTLREHVLPLLKKTESVWQIKGKKERQCRQSDVPPGEASAAEEKSRRRSSFLARALFKKE
ncbi:MAG: hypothetical protein M1827_004994 [Pycnora praestabilis]|nr:MAG: hypothetical protein M1827_004994 [Pycnora praestabilis]